jgi:hypothetical protein
VWLSAAVRDSRWCVTHPGTSNSFFVAVVAGESMLLILALRFIDDKMGSLSFIDEQ